MLSGMALACYTSSELDATVVAPIWSNPEYCLEQPVDYSSAVSPGDVVAPAFGACMMFRDPLHSESLTGRAHGHGLSPRHPDRHRIICTVTRSDPNFIAT